MSSPFPPKPADLSLLRRQPHALERLVAFGTDLLAAAEAAGVTLRFLGSVGVALRCQDRIDLAVLPPRNRRDMDLVCTSRQFRSVWKFLASLGYQGDMQPVIPTNVKRASFGCRPRLPDIDLYVDYVDFCFRLDLKNRIDIDPQTITLADLVLSKLQRTPFRIADVQDLCLLLGLFETGGSDGQCINVDRICDVTSRDFRRYAKAIDRLGVDEGVLASSIAATVNSTVVAQAFENASFLKRKLIAQPKSLGWRFQRRFTSRETPLVTVIGL